MITVRPKIRLQQTQIVQYHKRGKNPKELSIAKSIVSGTFLAMINNITSFLNFLSEKHSLYSVYTC